ncbi:Signal transduction histidine kinase [Gracilibacillus orientalis]|uniref:histidine kinase n=1 Tax=Gracilibacillus orientalis TaxID=334253 RepID=A0A1I4QY32_9BACI|nr:sensor histidine kinase [Gracilibacillus orientalis]SFM44921.1 Signal transduction histidine kinase [Gracilibacillus orientalis]
MKGYLKDQIGSIIFFYSQIAIVMIVAQLASSLGGSRIGNSDFLYMLIIVTFFLAIYHISRYAKYRDIYRYTIDDATESAWLPDTPDHLTSQLKEHYEKQYQSYKQQVELLHSEKKQETIFMQQWIHQMKTPLSVMRLTLEKEEHNLPAQLKQNMDEELDRIKNGLQLALYQSRLQQFERDFHVEKIVVKDLVHTIIKEYKSNFIRNRVYPKVEIDPSIHIYTDQKWLGFVLEQITSNAIKYTGDSNSTIYYQAAVWEGAVELKVIDHGIGIPQQDIKRIFDPFFTGENGRHYRESTGMGLFLAKQICDSLEHQLEVSSEPQKGTTIMIRFDPS